MFLSGMFPSYSVDIHCQCGTFLIIPARLDSVMPVSETKPIPVRLDHDLIKRLDRAAERLGNTRTGVIKLCLTAFLDHFEAEGAASLPLNWAEIVAYWDRRTRRSRGDEPSPSVFPEVKDAGHILNEPAGSKPPNKPPVQPTEDSPRTSADAPRSTSRTSRSRKVK